MTIHTINRLNHTHTPNRVHVRVRTPHHSYQQPSAHPAQPAVAPAPRPPPPSSQLPFQTPRRSTAHSRPFLRTPIQAQEAVGTQRGRARLFWDRRRLTHHTPRPRSLTCRHIRSDAPSPRRVALHDYIQRPARLAFTRQPTAPPTATAPVPAPQFQCFTPPFPPRAARTPPSAAAPVAVQAADQTATGAPFAHPAILPS
ncbi:hypothetical protein EDC01DRAFT_782027 [Geopyxis carbonaria]|nr:hypothetical protein EDC01DRAFT_782027 [Geopyxis carbonaria]